MAVLRRSKIIRPRRFDQRKKDENKPIVVAGGQEVPVAVPGGQAGLDMFAGGGTFLGNQGGAGGGPFLGAQVTTEAPDQGGVGLSPIDGLGAIKNAGSLLSGDGLFGGLGQSLTTNPFGTGGIFGPSLATGGAALAGAPGVAAGGLTGITSGGSLMTAGGLPATAVTPGIGTALAAAAPMLIPAAMMAIPTLFGPNTSAGPHSYIGFKAGPEGVTAIRDDSNLDDEGPLWKATGAMEQFSAKAINDFLKETGATAGDLVGEVGYYPTQGVKGGTRQEDLYFNTGATPRDDYGNLNYFTGFGDALADYLRTNIERGAIQGANVDQIQPFIEGLGVPDFYRGGIDFQDAVLDWIGSPEMGRGPETGPTLQPFLDATVGQPTAAPGPMNYLPPEVMAQYGNTRGFL